jgi:predicted DNA-binding transcriptional regulator AlpA
MDASVNTDSSPPPQKWPDILTAQQFADYVQISIKTVYKWNSRRKGPPRIKKMWLLRYRKTVVDKWLESTHGSRRT